MSNAIYYTNNKVVGGRKGWRMPTLEELASLVDPTQGEHGLPASLPRNTLRAMNFAMEMTDMQYGNRKAEISLSNLISSMRLSSLSRQIVTPPEIKTGS